MKIRLAKRIGFCFGVKRAVAMAEAALKDTNPVYSLGSIIHNRQVVSGLSKKGLRVVKDVGRIKEGAVIVSSHGISPKITKRILMRRLKLVDTTCPFVSNAQRIAKSLSGAGYNVIIVGDRRHPEVRALVDFVAKGAIVVKDEKEARRLKLKALEKVSIISQTTQSTNNFLNVARTIMDKKPKELKLINTICKDAEERQRDASNLAGEVDAMLVVGGRNSANTRRLFEVCKKVLKNSHLIETEDELGRGWFKQGYAVGITSGASTPDWLVRRVVNGIKVKGKDRKLKIPRRRKN